MLLSKHTPLLLIAGLLAAAPNADAACTASSLSTTVAVNGGASSAATSATAAAGTPLQFTALAGDAGGKLGWSGCGLSGTASAQALTAKASAPRWSPT